MITKDSKEKIKSPLNYIGGKYKLLDQLVPLFPKKINNFVDIFAGGFNVGINANAKKIYLNDNLFQLIEMYKGFYEKDTKTNLKHIRRRIKKFNLSLTNANGYKELRKYYNENKNPLDLFVLTAYSFNHQIRFNNKYEFNNPFGKERSSFNKKMEKNLILFLDEMHRKEIIFSSKCFYDFDFSFLTREDYVYCDPPYLITTGTYNDGKRGFKGWNEEEETNLLKKLDELDAKGIKFGLSNVLEHKGRENILLKEWLGKNKKYKKHQVSSNYKNSSYRNSKTKDFKSMEVFITNV